GPWAGERLCRQLFAGRDPWRYVDAGTAREGARHRGGRQRMPRRTSISFDRGVCRIVLTIRTFEVSLMKEISAGGVVYRRTKSGAIEVQLIQDRYGRTSLPKGKMEPGETVEETALREIVE